MREVALLKQNAEKWRHFEKLLSEPEYLHPDQTAELFSKRSMNILD